MRGLIQPVVESIAATSSSYVEARRWCVRGRDWPSSADALLGGRVTAYSPLWRIAAPEREFAALSDLNTADALRSYGRI